MVSVLRLVISRSSCNTDDSRSFPGITTTRVILTDTVVILQVLGGAQAA